MTCAPKIDQSEHPAGRLAALVPRFGLLSLLAMVTAVAVVAAASRYSGAALWGLAAVALSLSALPVGIAAVLLAKLRGSRSRVLPFLAFAVAICFAAALAMLVIGELLSATRPSGQATPPDDRRSLGR